MRTVVVNQEFKDRVTGRLYKKGETVEMPDARIEEIKEVNPRLVTAIGEKKAETNGTAEELEAVKAEASASKGEAERLTRELAEANTVIEELRKELEEAKKEAKSAKKTSAGKKDE